jgi:ArsR family transcriptional regulator
MSSVRGPNAWRRSPKRSAIPYVCSCELVPLFDLSQPTVSHHLKKLRDAGIVGSERQGLWAYYYVIPDALKEFSAWLT